MHFMTLIIIIIIIAFVLAVIIIIFHHNVWGEITYQFLNVNDTAVEILSHTLLGIWLFINA